ncbi:MAG: ribosome maturation factor RimM [Tannerella sp.]|jgi:16S rRNA processing protein RimM|nr:ribosome maturation factor RimM [Tannerella sp.]
MINKEETIRIGYFAKTHGIKGELSLVTDYDLFENEDDPYVICDMDSILVPFFVESYRYKNDSVIFVKLIDIDDETAAKQFIHREVFYSADRFEALPQDNELTWHHLIGYKLECITQGELGLITQVDDSTSNILFNVDYGGKELLIPVADELVESINHDTRKIVMTLPEGLLDIND